VVTRCGVYSTYYVEETCDNIIPRVRPRFESRYDVLLKPLYAWPRVKNAPPRVIFASGTPVHAWSGRVMTHRVRPYISLGTGENRHAEFRRAR
jgi:hypothetical protein